MADNAVIGALRVSLGIDTAAFEDGLKRAQDKLGGFGRSVHASGIGAAIDEIFDRSRLKLLDEGAVRVGLFGSALEKLGGLGVGAAVGIGATALAFEGLSKSLEGIDKLGKLAQQTGVPVEALSKLKYAADLADVSTESLGGGLEKLGRAMSSAAQDIKGPAARAFDQLHVSVKNADGSLRPVYDVVGDLAARFAPMQDGATKTALAMALFGRSGAELIPLLNEGKEGIAAAAAEAERFGLVLDDKTVKGAEAFNDNMKRVGEAATGIGIRVASDMAPAMQQLSGLMVDAANNTKLMHGVAQTLTFALQQLAGMAVLAGGAVMAAFQLTGGAIQAGGDLLHGKFGKAWTDQAAAGTAAIHTATGAVGLANRIFSGQAGPSGAPLEAGGTGKPPTPYDPAAAAAAAKLRAASEQAIDQAIKNELSARLGLVKDVEAVARLKMAEVDAETRQANDRLKGEAAQGKITAAAAATAIALNDKAAAEKKAAIQAAADVADMREAAATQARIAGYYDQIAALQASMATTAGDRNAIELKALAARQLDERRQLAFAQAEALRDAASDATKTAALKSDQAAERAALADKQAAETLAAQRQAQSRAIGEALAIDTNTLETSRAILDAQGALARTALERRQVATRMLQIEQQEEHARNVATLADPTSSAGAVDAAQKALASETERYADKLKALNVDAWVTDFNEAQSAIGGIASAIQSHNWAVAFSSLEQAIRQAEAAFSQAGTAADQAAAAAGIAAGVGNAIGGTAGSTITGAASGALTGFMVAGPIGAVVGGLLGGIGGFLSGSSAAKQQERQAAQQAAAQAQAHAQSVANEQAQLNIQLLQLQGDATGALAAQRAYELSQIDATNQALAQQVYDAQDAAAAKAAADQEAADRTQLLIRLATAQGDAEGALALQRQVELAATNDNLKALQQQVYAAEDAAAANQAAAQAAKDAAAAQQQAASAAADEAKSRLDLLVQLAQAQGDAATATALQRGLTLYQTPDDLKGLQRQVFAAQDAAAAMSAAQDKVTSAQQALANAAQAQASTLQQTVEAYQGAARSLASYLSSLNQTAASGLGATQQRARALAQFNATAARAQLGDVDAANALQAVGDQFLAASKAAASSGLDYARDQARVRAAVEAAEATATRQADLAQAQLDSLNAAVSAMGVVNYSVLSVKDAIDALAAAMGGVAALKGGGVAAQSLGANPGVNAILASVTGYAGAFGAGGFQSFITSADAATQAKARAVLTAYGQPDRIVGFATGGMGRVGGSGGIDSQLVQMRLTPGELVSVSHGDAAGATTAALVDLGRRMDRQEQYLAKIADASMSLNLQATAGDGLRICGSDPTQPIDVKVAA